MLKLQYQHYQILVYPTEYSYKHSFTHLQFVGWSDHGAPEKTDTAIELVRTVRKLVARNTNSVTILVHCAAGIGRTGTFISLYQLMEELDNHFLQYQNLLDISQNDSQRFDEESIDIFKTVLTLRKERSGMVGYKIVIF